VDRAGEDRREKCAALDLRRGAPSDAHEAAEVLSVALAHLAATQGRPIAPPPPQHSVPALEHLATSQPGGFWVAKDGERTAGFAASSLRNGVWFLGALFVHPDYQGTGLGRRLMESSCSASLGDTPASVLAVMSSGGNPVSNSLYASHGMYPWLPVLYMEAKPPLRLPVLPMSGLQPELITYDDLPDLAAIDAVVTTIDRSRDHEWMLRSGRRGWVFRRGGRAAAYGFLRGDGTMDPGQLGPVAALAADDVRPALAWLLGQVENDAERVLVTVPGPNVEAQRLLWGCGFTFRGVVALLGSSRPFGHFDRYTLAGDVLL
jgi:GNAT superfamily N-acetyltransferase